MNEFSLDDDLVKEYLAESREHLTTIEVDLLAMERAGAAIDEPLVNRVFRAAHSIKGGAGFFDFIKIRELAHRTENVLDMIRSRQMVPSADIANILLLAFDQLRIMIDNHAESEEAEISGFVEALTRLSEQSLPEEKKHLVSESARVSMPGLEKFLEVSALDLDIAQSAGRLLYIISFDLLADVQRRGHTPLDVFHALLNAGEMLDSALDFDSVGTLDEEPSQSVILDVLYAGSQDQRALSQLLGIEAAKITRVGEPASSELAVTLRPSELVAATSPVIVTAGDSVKSSPASGGTAEASVRLPVSLLDSLMSLAGELVLARNQLSETLGAPPANRDERAVAASAHRINAVTSELQEAVTLTRMQPVGVLFAKFPRLVRDLAKDLGKSVELKVEGEDVELDKTILEGLSDPLTHMIRNSMDHGIEMPSVRMAAGKPAAGAITLRASHQAGQVVLEVRDDGKGLSAEKIAASTVARGMVAQAQVDAMTEREKIALIFRPGVSTSEKISSVSGRGVGMDVVKTNIDKLGGKIEIDSTVGKGSAFRIKLPLTLAIIPSLLISEAGQRFAIPQVSVGELIRIPASGIAERIDHAGDAEVLILRNRLVPLLHFADVLGIPRARQENAAMNIVLTDTGQFEYGLIVERLHDTVEIVVKPLGRHLQGIRDYAGATILGDGEVALILDASGIADRGGITEAMANAAVSSRDAAEQSEQQSLLVFHNAPNELCAVQIDLVTRIEKLMPGAVEYVGGRRTMQYQGNSLPLVMLRDLADVASIEETQQWVVLVFECAGRPMGLVAAEPLDLVECSVVFDCVTLRQPGIAGSAILGQNTTLMIDIFELAATVKGIDGEATTRLISAPSTASMSTVLVADDSDFFRGQIQRLVESVGYRCISASDGQEAWNLLDEHAGEISLVATDVEMPRMDGLALARHIRADKRFLQLPIIALSSLAGEEEIARGMAAGVSEYHVKLDRDVFLETIRRSLQ